MADQIKAEADSKELTLREIREELSKTEAKPVTKKEKKSYYKPTGRKRGAPHRTPGISRSAKVIFQLSPGEVETFYNYAFKKEMKITDAFRAAVERVLDKGELSREERQRIADQSPGLLGWTERRLHAMTPAENEVFRAFIEKYKIPATRFLRFAFEELMRTDPMDVPVEGKAAD